MTWFPRPAAPDSIDPGSGPFSRERLFRLLSDPTAEEWRHKVGVISPHDGSAKTTTRLLCSDGWVFKTDLSMLCSERAEAVQKRKALEERMRALDIWHPSKFWFTCQIPDGWINISCCRFLVTLRNAGTAAEKVSLWTAMIGFALDADRRYGVGLDVSPSNFAQAPSGGPLFYIDDETYPSLGLTDLVEVFAARLGEEQTTDLAFFEDWGQHLRPLFLSGPEKFSLENILQAFSGHPVLIRLQEQTDALIATLAREDGLGPAMVQPDLPRGRICVLGDIHANWPALEAVLADANQKAVTGFLCLGDLVGYGPHPEACIQALKKLTNLCIVKGNHDHIVGSGAVDQDTNKHARWTHAWTIDRLSREWRQWLQSLPQDWEQEEVLAVHGAPVDPNRFSAYVYELTYKENLEHLTAQGKSLCFYGHTHVPYIHRLDADGEIHKIRPEQETPYPIEGTLLVNPGAVGQPRDGDTRAAYLIWDQDQQTLCFHRVTYDRAKTFAALEAEAFPDALKVRLDWGR